MRWFRGGAFREWITKALAEFMNGLIDCFITYGIMKRSKESLVERHSFFRAKSHPTPTLQHCIFAFQPQRGNQPTQMRVSLTDVLSLYELITMQSADHGLKQLDPEAKINVSSFLASLQSQRWRTK